MLYEVENILLCFILSLKTSPYPPKTVAIGWMTANHSGLFLLQKNIKKFTKRGLQNTKS